MKQILNVLTFDLLGLMTPFPTISKDVSLENKWFPTQSLDVEYVLEMPFSNFKTLRCQEGHQRHPYPPSPELDPWRTGGS